jgi:carboxypeptidase D
MANLTAMSAKCNYTDYMSKFLTYPPKGLLPLPGKSTEFDKGCDMWDTIFNAAIQLNPGMIPLTSPLYSR